MMTSRAEWRRLRSNPEGRLLSHLHMPRIDQPKRTAVLKDRGTLLIRLDLNKQEFWSWRLSLVVHWTVFFSMLFLLACGLKSLLSAVSLFVLSTGTWLWELRRGKGDEPVVHRLNWPFCPLFFHCSVYLEFFFKGLVFPCLEDWMWLEQWLC